MATYLTGCTHYGHERIIELCDRPFDSVGQMDETLIRRHNEVVGPDDIVFHLGDFGFGDPEYSRYILSRLNGKTNLVLGNHDHWDRIPIDAFNTIDKYVTFKFHRKKVTLFHYPMLEWDGMFSGGVHFHCHTHSKSAQDDLPNWKYRYNVGVDAHDFRPVELGEAFHYVQGVEARIEKGLYRV